MDERTRQLLLLLRAALIQALGAVEDVLGMERSIPRQKERRNARRIGA